MEKIKRIIQKLIIRYFISKEFKDCFINLMDGYYNDLDNYNQHLKRMNKKSKTKTLRKITIIK